MSKTKIINCTPHPVTVVKRLLNGRYVVVARFEASKNPVRLSMETVRRGWAGNVPLSHTVFGEPYNLPEQEQGVLLIVSQLVKNAIPWRRDLIVPAEVVRDESGIIVGCQSFGL